MEFHECAFIEKSNNNGKPRFSPCIICGKRYKLKMVDNTLNDLRKHAISSLSYWLQINHQEAQALVERNIQQESPFPIEHGAKGYRRKCRCETCFNGWNDYMSNRKTKGKAS